MQWVYISLSSTLAGPPGLLGALCRGTHAPLADRLYFSNRERCNTRLRPSKNPQPSVDLIHMAACAQYHQQPGDYLFYYEILAWLRLLYLWFTYRPVKHAFTKVTYDLLLIYFSTYDLHMHIVLTYITHDLCFTNDLLMIYFWLTYEAIRRLNGIKIFFYTKMDDYIFSNEIHMEYVWNIRVPIVVWNIHGICLIYNN